MYRSFYKNGIAEIDFKNSDLNNLLFKLYSGKIKDNFFLKTKYDKTYDLRPNVYDYDPVILEVLKEHCIKSLIHSHTLRDMSLFHIQIRVVNNTNSYMDWHRDTYYSDGKTIGKTPHALKIIYYPKFNEEKSERLKYLLGSNRILFPDNTFDNQLGNILSVKTVESSNEKAILFDVNGLHSVVPEKENNSSIRLIYSFLHKQQIIDDHDNEPLHINAMKKYEELWK